MYPKFVYSFLYGIYYTGVSSPVWLPVLILTGIFHENEIAKYVLIPLAVICMIWLVFVVPFMSSSAAWARVVLEQDFWDGASFGWSKLRQVLAPIPIIGRYFEEKDDENSGEGTGTG
jgi:hypothetical protein